MSGSDTWREDAKKWLLDNCGEQWYVWRGQNIEQGHVDCSGLVLEVLKKFKVLPESFGDVKAQGLSRCFRYTRSPQVCDLVFYGKDWNHVTHVMFYVGELGGYDVEGTWLSYDHCVAGMSGGKKNMSSSWARIMGAALWVKTSPRYRRDFLGYRRVE